MQMQVWVLLMLFSSILLNQHPRLHLQWLVLSLMHRMRVHSRLGHTQRRLLRLL